MLDYALMVISIASTPTPKVAAKPCFASARVSGRTSLDFWAVGGAWNSGRGTLALPAGEAVRMSVSLDRYRLRRAAYIGPETSIYPIRLEQLILQ